jgi:DNA-binding GntR family transcriptional regulator
MVAATPTLRTPVYALVKRALPDQIFDLVRERIISGKVAGDAPIRQDALASELGVSKIPLREALGRLEKDGLIISHANRGFFVSPLSVEEAYDVFELRLKIEPDAVGEAARKAGPADHAAAKSALAALDAAVEARGSNVGALNRTFHTALIRPSGRSVTLQTVERLQVIAERYVRKHLEVTDRESRAVREHNAMFAAWAAGDAERAADLTTDHIRETLKDLRQQFHMATS